MKFLILTIYALLFIPLSAMAQDKAASDDAAMKEAVCKLLHMQKQKAEQNQRYVPGAAYKAGVDAYGNPVISADVDNAPQSEAITIPIEIDLAERFDIPELGEAEVNQAEIQPDGRVIFGKNDITGKMNDWCGTAVPEDLDIEKPGIEAPTINEPEMTDEKPLVNQTEKIEMQPVEIKPVIAQPPQEIGNNNASDGTKVQKIMNNITDLITGTDYRDYNE